MIIRLKNGKLAEYEFIPYGPVKLLNLRHHWYQLINHL
jgi:hypothetical protein